MGVQAQADEFAAIENVRRVIRHGSMLLAIAGGRVKLLGRHGSRGAPPPHRSAAYWYATEVHPRPILMTTASAAGASSFSETAQTPSEWTITSTVSPPEA